MNKQRHKVLFSLLGVTGLFLTQWVTAAPALPSSRGTPSASDETEMAAFVRYYARQMTAATDSDAMVRARLRLLKPLKSSTNPPSAEFIYDFGTRVNIDFTPLLAKPKTALNAAITIGSIPDISMQAALQTALQNPNPAVRYWGAKGLGNIFNQLLAIGPAYQQSIEAVQQAVAVEPDPLVAEEMCAVLLTQNPVPPGTANLATQALARAIAGYQDVVPDNLAIAGSLAADLAVAVSHGAALTAAQKNDAMHTTSQLMSYTAQYLKAGLLDSKQQVSAFSTMAKAAAAMNAVTGTTNFSLSGLNAQSDPSLILLRVNGITGAQGQAGLVQKLFPKVAIPPRISALLPH